ncbi:hypothetical protein Rs2_49092 [Raphanus sativus]|nr:hypothetical protein Rs2_49092 [Raphanus sativus]
MPPPSREDTPLLGKGPPLSSQFKTFANIFIAVVGAGVLGLPYAFKRTGWLMGVLLLLSVSLLTHHCMMLLVYTRRKLDSLNGGGFSKIGSFGDLGFAVCGSLGRLVVDLFIILSQAGFCVGYLIFIGTTLANLFDPDSPPVSGISLHASALNSSESPLRVSTSGDASPSSLVSTPSRPSLTWLLSASSPTLLILPLWPSSLLRIP